MPTILYASDATFLRFDSATNVRVTASDSVTRHPTERGVVITDHVQAEPLVVSIVGVFTESPLDSQVRGGGATEGLDGVQRVRAAMDWLNAHRRQRLTLTSDDLDDLDDLVITRLPDEVGVQRQRVVALELQQVMVATTEYVQIPPEVPPAATTHAVATGVDLGEQGTVSGDEEPAQQERDISAAALFLESIGFT